MKNAIIVPCYNEANRLKFDEFKTFLNTNPNYIICFVNDGSKDNTLQQLQNFAADHKRCLVYDMPQNGGKAEAVRRGTNFINSKYNVESIGFMDADLATGFEDYTMLVQELKDNDLKMVFGSRKMDQDSEVERSAFRKLASWAVGLMIKLIIGLPIKDTQCGAKVFHPGIARYVFNKSFMSRWLFDVEMFIRIKSLYKVQAMNVIKEVAVSEWEEVEGSHITWQDSIKFPKELLEIALAYNVKPKFNNMIPILSTSKKVGPIQQAA